MKINFKKAQIAAIAALFVAPVMVAWFMFFGEAGTNQVPEASGVLAEPPIALGEMELPTGGDAGVEGQLTGRWSLLYMHKGACEQACQETLLRMRQVRLALGKDASRFQRVFVPLDAEERGESLAQAFPGMAVVRPDAPGRFELVEKAGARQPGELLLVDPMGNLVLSYPPDIEADGLFRDARHLLKLSKIG